MATPLGLKEFEWSQQRQHTSILISFFIRMLRVMLVRFVLYYYIVRSRFKTKCDRFDLASHISL